VWKEAAYLEALYLGAEPKKITKHKLEMLVVMKL
jgi:hypothetical protein